MAGHKSLANLGPTLALTDSRTTDFTHYKALQTMYVARRLNTDCGWETVGFGCLISADV